MYQTVGQDAIEYVAQCLDVSLYRRVISGTSLEQGSEYGSRAASSSSGVKGDETEDLYELLLDVKVGPVPAPLGPSANLYTASSP